MNEQSKIPFTYVSSVRSEKTAMHYQMRDHIILPIIREMNSRHLQVIAPKKHENSVFQLTGKTPNPNTACSEILTLTISDQGMLTLQRFIPDQNQRNPTETISVNPHTDPVKKLNIFLKTFRNELQRFNQSYSDAMMTHIVFHHHPLEIYRSLTRRSHIRKPL